MSFEYPWSESRGVKDCHVMSVKKTREERSEKVGSFHTHTTCTNHCTTAAQPNRPHFERPTIANSSFWRAKGPYVAVN